MLAINVAIHPRSPILASEVSSLSPLKTYSGSSRLSFLTLSLPFQPFVNQILFALAVYSHSTRVRMFQLISKKAIYQSKETIFSNESRVSLKVYNIPNVWRAQARV